MATPAELARLIDLHLSDLRDPEPNWTIGPSTVAGRGVFATRDIQQGEIIFRERALVVGPTARKGSILNTCVCCHKLLAVKDFLCKNKCTLPVCDKCADSPEHHNECQLFRRWQPMDMKHIQQNANGYNNATNNNNSNNNNSNGKNNGHGHSNVHGQGHIKGIIKGKKSQQNGSTTNGHTLKDGQVTPEAVTDKENKTDAVPLIEEETSDDDNYPPVNLMSLRLLTAIRVFFLDDEQRALINAMQANNDRGYRQEIIKAAQCFRRFPTTDKLFMDRLFRIVGVCNTNAFETPCKVDGHDTLLRGLFPLTAVMNHECTPNASHYFGKTCMVVVRAARFIPKGGEITTTYTKILWSNLTRCIFLRMTKNFTCDCVRCNDNTVSIGYRVHTKNF